MTKQTTIVVIGSLRINTNITIGTYGAIHVND